METQSHEEQEEITDEEIIEVLILRSREVSQPKLASYQAEMEKRSITQAQIQMVRSQVDSNTGVIAPDLDHQFALTPVQKLTYLIFWWFPFTWLLALAYWGDIRFKQAFTYIFYGFSISLLLFVLIFGIGYVLGWR
jgi:hypothetical protein